MPITRLISNIHTTPEQRQVLEQAFSKTLQKLHLVNRNDPVCELVARKVVEIGRTKGAKNPAEISDLVYNQLVPRE